MIEAIVFDFGGVLVSEQERLRRFVTYDAMLGWPTGEINRRLYAGPGWEQVSTGRLSIAEYWDQVGAELEPLLPPDFRYYRESFFDAPLVPDAVQLAWRLRRRYRLALLSNATVLLARRLAEERTLHGLFDEVVISAVVGLRKPQPEVYDLTSRRLGLPPESCVLIDDKARNTIAAERQGWQAIVHADVFTTQAALAALGVAPEVLAG